MTVVLVRRKDWRSRLDACFDGMDGKVFAWGACDCALYAADAILAMTDTDLAVDFRGKYSDRDGAMAAIAAAGFETYGEFAASLLPEISLGESRIGDVALVDLPVVGLCPAIIGGSHLSCMTLRGKGAMALSRAKRVFRVG